MANDLHNWLTGSEVFPLRPVPETASDWQQGYHYPLVEPGHRQETGCVSVRSQDLRRGRTHPQTPQHHTQHVQRRSEYWAIFKFALFS